MVNVGEKAETRRTAVAAGRVLVNRNTFELIRTGGCKKGDVLTVAQLAGIMGAKRTPDLIPLCHPIMISGVELKLELNETDCSEYPCHSFLLRPDRRGNGGADCGQRGGVDRL